jgi:UDP-N-acetylmuramate dehydrogenase
MQIKENVSLLPYNTFGINVNAKYFAEYQSVEELYKLLQSDLLKSNKISHIGRGSNLLFTADYEGIIVHSKIKFIEIIEQDSDNVKIRAGAGVLWDDFVLFCIQNFFYGVENLSLIPGEVGAAAVQNIGAYGAEVKDVIFQVETIDIQTQRAEYFSNDACKYAYRESVFKNELKGQKILTAVIFLLSKQSNFQLNYGNLESEILKNFDKINIQTVRDTVIKIRNEKLPNPEKEGNAGSFFKNPYISTAHLERIEKQHPNILYFPVNEDVVKVSAAWLIEQCGWKGKRLGNTIVHCRQPLVLINAGNASGTEILQLAESIQHSVKERFNIDLQPEVNFIS